MQKENIHTDQAPAAIGPYVQAVRVGEMIYTAGQGGLDPATGELVEGGVEAQAEQTMKNLSAVLVAAGSDFKHVVKTNIYLRYIKDFAAVNEVYASFFGEQVPARTTIATSALPLAALVEIDMIALVIETEQEEIDEVEIEEVEAIEESEEVQVQAKKKPKAKKKKNKKPAKGKKGKKTKKKK